MRTGVRWEYDAPTLGTASGQMFNFQEPVPEEILIQDIAHALANSCRFGGHTAGFLSVAQHSVLVSRLCDLRDARWGLLHDATEAYLGDVIKPVKRMPEMAGYGFLERRLMLAICDRFGLELDEPASVRHADRVAALLEQRDLLPQFAPRHDLSGVEVTVEPMLPVDAYFLFRDRAKELGLWS